MATAVPAASTQREPELLGQTVVVIGGSSGMGLETARRARAEGASVILTGRRPEALRRAALDVEALSTAAFDANDPAALERFFAALPAPIDHVMVTAGRPHYGRLLEMKSDELREALGDRILLATEVARNAVDRVRPGGTLLFISATEGAHPTVGTGSVSTVAAALPAAGRQPGARGRAGARQPDRSGLRRHAAIGIAARRRHRKAPRPAPRHPADRSCRRADRRRCARRTHHDQHRPHRGHLHHRWGPAAGRVLCESGPHRAGTGLSAARKAARRQRFALTIRARMRVSSNTRPKTRRHHSRRNVNPGQE